MAEAGNTNSLQATQGAATMPSIADNLWLRQIAVMVGIAASGTTPVRGRAPAQTPAPPP